MPNFLIRIILIFLFGSTLLPTQGISQTKYSQNDGSWNEISWNPSGIPSASNDVNIDHYVVIPKGITAEVNNLHIAGNGVLFVQGNLIVNGNITMANNSPEFVMDSTSIVTVFGDFSGKNKVDISISSYLFIHGNFHKDGSSNQGELNVDDGNIYIFGDVNGWPDDFTSCGGGYDGETPDKSDECDYGQETDFIENQDEMPPEVKELLDCFDLSDIQIDPVCEYSDVTLSVNDIPGVTYSWQKQIPGGTWEDIPGATSSSHQLTNVTASLSGNKYRVVVAATPENEINCNLVISNVEELIVIPENFTISAISGPSEICYNNGEVIYEVDPVPFAQTYNWALPQGWNIVRGQGTPAITVAAEMDSGEIGLTVTNSCGIQKQINKLVAVEVKGTWSGIVSTDWNTAENWECNFVPDLNTDVVLPSGLVNYPLLSSGETGYSENLTIHEGASLTIKGNKLAISGEIQNNGTFNAMEGTVEFRGNSFQIIPLNTFVNNQIENLFINNPSEVILNGSLEISEKVTLLSGALVSNNFLKLLSTPEKTALISGEGSGAIEGIITMQRYIDDAFGYKYFSSPFQNTTVGDFSNYIDLTASFPNFFKYVENRQDSLGNDATGWKNYTNLAGALQPMEGYALNFGNSHTSVTVEISGKTNNGPLTKNLMNHNGKYTRGFHLVGNPYPSPIDWNAPVGWTKTNIDDAIYFFTASDSSQYTGSYISYVNGISSSDGEVSSIIPSMQGFFVHVSDITADDAPTTGKLSMTNTVRINNFTQQFFKQTETEEFPLIRLSARFQNNNTADPLVIYFDPFANIHFEKKLDAHKLMNTEENLPDFYSITPSGDLLSINGMPNPEYNNYRIPLGLVIDHSGEIVIKLEDLEKISSGIFLYLIDEKRKIIQDLNSNSTYSFSAGKGNLNSRFYLQISSVPITDPAIAFNEPFSAIAENDEITVNLNLNTDQKGILKLSTISGQILRNLEVQGKGKVEIPGIRSAGIYLLTLYTKEEFFSKKILIKE